MLILGIISHNASNPSQHFFYGPCFPTLSSQGFLHNHESYLYLFKSGSIAVVSCLERSYQPEIKAVKLQVAPLSDLSAVGILYPPGPQTASQDT